MKNFVNKIKLFPTYVDNVLISINKNTKSKNMLKLKIRSKSNGETIERENI